MTGDELAARRSKRRRYPVFCDSVRPHIQALMRDGIPLSAIGSAAGVSAATVTRILKGDTKRCGYEIAQAILAVDAEAVLLNAFGEEGVRFPVAIVREHVSLLGSQGFSQRLVANAAGIKASTMSAIATGKRKTCSTDVANSILDLTHVEIFEFASGNMMVPSYPTRRRFEAMAALGWRAKDLNRVAVHNKFPPLGRKGVESNTQDFVTASTHHKTALMFRHIVAHEDGGPSAAARAHAARSGWRGPDEWLDIDAPDLADTLATVEEETGDEADALSPDAHEGERCTG